MSAIFQVAQNFFGKRPELHSGIVGGVFDALERPVNTAHKSSEFHAWRCAAGSTPGSRLRLSARAYGQRAGGRNGFQNAFHFLFFSRRVWEAAGRRWIVYVMLWYYELYKLMSTPLIRPGRVEEVDIACEIAGFAWEPAYAHYRRQMDDEMFDALFGDWRQSKADDIRNLCLAHPDQFLVAEVDGAIRGFATFIIQPEKSLGIVGNNAVHPDAQGQGLGNLLHQRIIEEFRKRHLKYAQVLVGLDDTHIPARASYRKTGFSPSYEYGIMHQKL
jgi:GNAT superfamily N-acetyltransferase